MCGERRILSEHHIIRTLSHHCQVSSLQDPYHVLPPPVSERTSRRPEKENKTTKTEHNTTRTCVCSFVRLFVSDIQLSIFHSMRQRFGSTIIIIIIVVIIIIIITTTTTTSCLSYGRRNFLPLLQQQRIGQQQKHQLQQQQQQQQLDHKLFRRLCDSTRNSIGSMSSASSSSSSAHDRLIPPPAVALPDENRGIYFSGYGQPVHESVERKTTMMMTPTKTRSLISSSLVSSLLSLLFSSSSSSSSSSTTVLVQVCAVGMNPVDAKGVIGDKLAMHWSVLRRWMHNRLVKDTRVGFDFVGRVIHVNKKTTTMTTKKTKQEPEPIMNEQRNSQNYSEDTHYDSCKEPTDDDCPFPHGTIVYGTMPPLQGSYAEYVQVPLHQIARAPISNNNNKNNNKASLTMEEIASLPLVGLTAWQALSPYVIPQGSSVLIVGGSGGTGHVSIQVAKALGAKYVVTVCSNRNIQFVRDCGATHVIDYSAPNVDVIVELQNVIRKDLQGQQFDIILDCVTSGDPADGQYNYPQKIRYSNPSIVTTDHLYQKLGGHWTEWIRATFARPGIFPHSWLWRDPRERLFWIKFPYSSNALQQLTDLAERGLLKPRIEKIYPEMTVDTVQQAMEDVLSRRIQGKVVIKVQP
jgi:NADPH:quinone reductase-like Zn-dependent oxidoreductase